MFRNDLGAARLAWLGEAKGNAAKTERRTKSRFLCPVDDDGCGCDFHGLRHSFISNRAEVPPVSDPGVMRVGWV